LKLWRALVCLVCLLLSTPAWGYQRVTIDDLPIQVCETIAREASNARIDDIYRDVKDGKTVYMVKYMKAGILWQLDVAASGTMLGRKRD
jgi:hypothetical protein